MKELGLYLVDCSRPTILIRVVQGLVGVLCMLFFCRESRHQSHSCQSLLERAKNQSMTSS